MSRFQISRYRNVNSFLGICDGPELRDRVTNYLRKIYSNKPADHVAADIGLPAETVKKWFSRQNTPNGPAIVRLIYCYGPNLLAAIMKEPPAWLDKAASEADIALFDHQIAQLEAAKAAKEARL